MLVNSCMGFAFCPFHSLRIACNDARRQVKSRSADIEVALYFLSWPRKSGGSEWQQKDVRQSGSSSVLSARTTYVAPMSESSCCESFMRLAMWRGSRMSRFKANTVCVLPFSTHPTSQPIVALTPPAGDLSSTPTRRPIP